MQKIATTKLEVQANERYLQQQYCTLEHLLRTCDISGTELFAYIDAECLPQHSYVWQEQAIVSSGLAKQRWVQQQTFYYHPRHILLLQDLITWHKYMSLEDIAKAVHQDFKDHYIAKLKDLNAFSDVFVGYMGDDGEINLATLDVLLDNEWHTYLQGIYGGYTYEPTAESIAIQNTMIRRIGLLTLDGTKATLSDADRMSLTQSLTAFNEVTSLFAPFERAQSLREQWYDMIKVKYSI